MIARTCVVNLTHASDQTSLSLSAEQTPVGVMAADAPTGDGGRLS